MRRCCITEKDRLTGNVDIWWIVADGGPLSCLRSTRCGLFAGTRLFAVAEEISDLAMVVPDMELQEHDGIGATKENSLWTFMIRSSFTVTMTVPKGSQSEMRRHIEDARHRRRPHEDPVARHESKPFF